MILSLLRKGSHGEAADVLYALAVDQARKPAFYEALGVADTVEGRSELLMLHIYLLLSRLKGEPAAKGLSRDLIEAFFSGMDASLREAGVGDLSVGRKMRAIGEGLYGRMAAYDAARENGASEDALPAALARNVYFSADASAGSRLAKYVRVASLALADQPLTAFANGGISFPGPEIGS